MGLFGRIFGKQTAKIGLAMHIRSAKYYAKRSKRTARATKKAYDNQQKWIIELEKSMREKPRCINNSGCFISLFKIKLAIYALHEKCIFW